MESVIKEFIKIEESAKEISEQTMQDQKNLNRNIKLKTEEIEKEIDESTKKKIYEIKNADFEETGERISEISVETQTKFSDLEIKYSQNFEKWQTEIFNAIIGR